MSTVAIGRYVLTVGEPCGSVIDPGAREGRDPAEVREGLERPRVIDAAERSVNAAAEATARAEEALDLYRAVADGTLLDPSKLSGRIDVLLAVLERLDRDGNHEEAIRLARALNGLLALLFRWAELARTLGIAGRAAEAIGDRVSAGWVEHELGTLHLAAGDPVAADRHLSEAQQLRSGWCEQRATEHNLAQLRRARPPHWRRLLAVAAALLLLLLGGGVGWVLADDDEPPPVGTAQLAVAADGDGAVISEPAGIDCGDTCERDFAEGTRIVLTPDAADGWTFDRWGGACDGDGRCRFRLRGDRQVTATFLELEDEATPEPTVTLEVEPPAGGTVTSEPAAIDCPDTCSAEVPADQPVTLSATPDEGFVFRAWGGDCEGAGACPLDMRENQRVSATFGEEHTLTVSIVGPGTVTSDPAGIDCTDGECSARFPAGIVTLTATGDFQSWSEPCASRVPTCEVALDADRAVTATFSDVD